MATSFDLLSRLLQQLYAGVVEMPPWEPFLEELRRETACVAALIMLAPPESAAVNLLSIAGGQPEISSAYRDQLFAHEPMLNLPEGRVVTLHEFVGAHEIQRNAYYNDFMRPWGIGFVLGADVQTTAGYSARLRLCRSPDGDDFEVSTRELIDALLPHLRQAVEIFDQVHRLQVEKIELNDAFDRLGVATFLLDASGRVARPNQCAVALLSSGEDLTVRHGKLSIGAKSAQLQLAQVLDEVREAKGASAERRRRLPKVITIGRGPGLPVLAIVVRRLQSPADLRADHVPAVAVYVCQPEPGSRVPEELVRELLGVTRAEAALAARLASGATLDEVAGDLGITRATARTQLYSVFRKTGLHRQSELVALISQASARLPQG